MISACKHVGKRKYTQVCLFGEPIWQLFDINTNKLYSGYITQKNFAHNKKKIRITDLIMYKYMNLVCQN
jgi:hypothetical protein